MSLPNNDSKERINSLIENGELTQAQIASECDISPATVSLFLSGKYAGDNATIERTLESFLVRHKIKMTLEFNQFDFVETSVFHKINETAILCQMTGRIGLVYGDSGLGKTRTIEEYAGRNPGVIIVRAHVKHSTKDVFSDIHKAIGFNGRGNVHSLLNDIVDKLKGSRRLLVIDEAEHLTAGTLDEIRQINDRAKVGILYVGLEQLRTQLKTLKREFEYIVNRISIPRNITALTQEDVRLLVKSVLPEVNQNVVNEFYLMSGGNTRLLELLIYTAYRSMSYNKTNLTPKLIQQAAEYLSL